MPAHGAITTQTIGIVHIVVSAKTAKDGLTELPRHAVPSILAGTAVVENTLGHLSQAEGIVKLPIGEQPGIRGDLGTVEFKLQATVKNDPQAQQQQKDVINGILAA